MSAFICDHGDSYELFGSGGGAELAEDIGVPLLASVPLEPALASGGDNGDPVVLLGQGPAAVALRALVGQIVEQVAPPRDSDVDMSGCSARLLEAVAAALDDA